MSQPGRPKQTEKHTIAVKAYFTDAEYAQLAREAHQYGISMSAYIRYLLLHASMQKAAA